MDEVDDVELVVERIAALDLGKATNIHAPRRGIAPYSVADRSGHMANGGWPPAGDYKT